MARKPQGEKTMKFHQMIIPLLAGCIGIALCVFILTKGKPQAVSVSVQPQCAHWAIFRTAQLLGVPTEPGAVQRLLPNQPQGHTLAQVVETLAQIGLNAEGYRDNWDTLSKQHFPCIVHLEKPEHYIVVSGMEPERGYIHLFDDAGNRTRQKRETFEKKLFLLQCFYMFGIVRHH
jgi:ABC-type bacteriocin/lantibiotic exporter with double-glycine peptidase domain